MNFMRSRLKLVLILLCIASFFACLRNVGQEVTSTSVTTGNPSGIRLVFKKDSLPVSLNGKVEIFAMTQIPVHGFSPNPLLIYRLENASSIEIEGKSIESIPDSLWPAGSLEGDSIWKFNAVISGDSEGSVVKGMAFKKAMNGSGFARPGLFSEFDSHTEASVTLSGLLNYVGKMDTNRLSFYRDHYIFIYGTGFSAKEEHGLFKFTGLPVGYHEAFLLPLPGSKDGQASGEDSAAVYTLNSVLSTEIDSLYRGTLFEMVELPDSLKHK
jgi:hypothetical protein